MDWQGHQRSPTDLPGLIVWYPDVEVSSVILVENIANGADNFLVSLVGVILCVKGVLEYSISGGGKFWRQSSFD